MQSLDKPRQPDTPAPRAQYYALNFISKATLQWGCRDVTALWERESQRKRWAAWARVVPSVQSDIKNQTFHSSLPMREWKVFRKSHRCTTRVRVWHGNGRRCSAVRWGWDLNTWNLHLWLSCLEMMGCTPGRGRGAKGLKSFEMNVAAAALPLTHKRSSEPTLLRSQTDRILKHNKWLINFPRPL